MAFTTRNKIKIRYATSDDLMPLVILENECFICDKISKQRFRQLLKKPSVTLLIAEYKKKIAGYALIFFRKNSKIARLYSLAVEKDYRQHGIATTLCHEIEKEILKHHCQTLMLEVRPDNIPAIQFYKKNHYEIVGTYHQFYEDGTDAIRMRKIT